MWRPNDWKNPYSTPDSKPDMTYVLKYFAYEDGADAMLEAIKKHIDPEDAKAYGSQCCKCLELFGEYNGDN